MIHEQTTIVLHMGDAALACWWFVPKLSMLIALANISSILATHSCLGGQE
jgi:hypothetical protein